MNVLRISSEDFERLYVEIGGEHYPYFNVLTPGNECRTVKEGEGPTGVYVYRTTFPREWGKDFMWVDNRVFRKHPRPDNPEVLAVDDPSNGICVDTRPMYLTCTRDTDYHNPLMSTDRHFEEIVRGVLGSVAQVRDNYRERFGPRGLGAHFYIESLVDNRLPRQGHLPRRGEWMGNIAIQCYTIRG